MSYEFCLPDVGEGLSEALVLEWKCAEGGIVQEDDVLVIVQTDKAVIEIPSPVSGRLLRQGAQPHETLGVGAVLAILDENADTESPAVASWEPSSLAQSRDANADPSTAQRGAGSLLPAGRVGQKPLASPAVRRLAAQAGVDLAQVRGSGPQGRIVREDVEKPSLAASVVESGDLAEQIEGQQWSSQPAERLPASAMRRSTAAAVLQSWRSAPHIFDWRDADGTQLLALRETLRSAHAERGRRVSILSLMVAVVAEAVRLEPAITATWDDRETGRARPAGIHIGVAVAVDDGILVPVMRHVDQRSLLDIGEALDELVAKARRGRLSAEEATGATITVNNIGAIGGIYGSPILPLGQTVIVGFGRLTDRVVPIEGVPSVRPMLPLSTAADHRAIDGRELCAFAAIVVRMIENPLLLLTTRLG